MAAVKVPRAKSILMAALVVFSIAFVAELLWLRQAGDVAVSSWSLGLSSLAPLGITACFMGLWSLSLHQGNRHLTLAAAPFWIFLLASLALWASFYFIFVFGPAGGAAA